MVEVMLARHHRAGRRAAVLIVLAVLAAAGVCAVSIDVAVTPSRISTLAVANDPIRRPRAVTGPPRRW
jgi:hypothetical protein